ncbi:hypothetical protein J2776_002917 [Paraburkholderia caledonica]|uniref:Uncharacterized protein n=1 Tax=Paraburkholderia caledonica TaxID=134536 RepID=A0ABU1KZ44_9BURK|nr:hypothetical protein [Paraburkholderia caledonica]
MLKSCRNKAFPGLSFIQALKHLQPLFLRQVFILALHAAE